MSERFTIEILEEKLKKGKIQGYQAIGSAKLRNEKKSKYGNQKTEVNGIVFDSKREAKRYAELLILLKTGVIGLLERQISYELNEGGTHSLKYVCDFRYLLCATGGVVVEDSKGFRTREFKRKAKLMKKIYDITVKEV